ILCPQSLFRNYHDQVKRLVLRYSVLAPTKTTKSYQPIQSRNRCLANPAPLGMITTFSLRCRGSESTSNFVVPTIVYPHTPLREVYRHHPLVQSDHGVQRACTHQGDEQGSTSTDRVRMWCPTVLRSSEW
ncbi:unnamed protein product, partial [Sphacelaria rigidula]